MCTVVSAPVVVLTESDVYIHGIIATDVVQPNLSATGSIAVFNNNAAASVYAVINGKRSSHELYPTSVSFQNDFQIDEKN